MGALTAAVSVKSGRWSDAETWSGGVVPVDGDDVTVTAGHTVVFDVCMCGGVGVGLTVDGVLQFSAEVMSVLRLKHAISGVGNMYLSELCMVQVVADLEATP